MKPNTIGYCLKQGFANIGRNKMFSFASILTMCACIFLFGIFFMVTSNFQQVMRNVESDVAITVFFDDGLSQEKIDQIGIKISQRPEVASYTYISGDDAWEQYKEEYFQGDEEVAEAFQNDNPLSNSANFQIYMNSIEDQDSLVSYLQNVDGVREVRQSESVANTMTDLNRLISIVSSVIILILICVAIFLISNTVRIGISVRSEEIGIMRIIGATSFFVRAPFIIEGIIIGLIGSAIPLAVLFAGYGRVITYINTNFAFLNGLLTFQSTASVFRVLLPIGLLLGVGIGYIGSFFTVRHHIRSV